MGLLDDILGSFNSGQVSGIPPDLFGAPPSGALPQQQPDAPQPMQPMPGQNFPPDFGPGGVPMPRPRPLESFYDAVPTGQQPAPRVAREGMSPAADDGAPAGGLAAAVMGQGGGTSANALDPYAPQSTDVSARARGPVSVPLGPAAGPPPATAPMQASAPGPMSPDALIARMQQSQQGGGSPMLRRAVASLGAGLANVKNSPFKGEVFSQAAGPSLQAGAKSDQEDLDQQTKVLDATIKAHALAEKPTFGQIGEDSFGAKQYGFINAPQGKVTPYTPGTLTSGPTGGAPTAAGTPATPPTGKQYLDGLPIPMRTIVEKVANYEINPASLSTKGGHREKIMAAASQYNPDFDGALAPARFAAIKEFNSGGANSPAGTITAGNTAIQHLGALSDISQKLGGTSGWGPLNSVINKGNVAYKGMENNPDLGGYNNTLGRFSEEATKFYRGIGGSESDIKRAIESVTAAQSPEARNRAIATQADLMQSKINALQARWKQATGPTGWTKIAKDFPIIQDKSATALDNIMERDGRPKYSKSSAEPGSTAATPATSAATPVEGTIIANPQTGARQMLKGGQWVPVK